MHNLHFVRHAKTVLNTDTCYGWLDIELAENYKATHNLVLDYFKEIKIDTIYSSDSIRCKKLANDFNSPYIISKNLRELNFGNWEGLLWNSINEKELNQWMYNYLYEAPPNGESTIDLLIRFYSFLKELSKNKKSSNTLIITSAGIIKCALHHFNGLALSDSVMQKIGHGQIISFSIGT